MPKRTPIDPQLVLETFERLNNGTAVARELGVHRNTVYQILRRFRGKCRMCTNDIKEGEICCETCLARQRNYQRKRRMSRIETGICVACYEPVSPPSTEYCEVHRLSHMDANKRLYARKRFVHGKLPTAEQRERNVREKYGESGLAVWRESGGKCHICAVSYEDKAIHIHHIDSDDKNHAEENLVCLCFHCHMLTERLLQHHCLADLLVWFNHTYPDHLPSLA